MVKTAKLTIQNAPSPSKDSSSLPVMVTCELIKKERSPVLKFVNSSRLVKKRTERVVTSVAEGENSGGDDFSRSRIKTEPDSGLPKEERTTVLKFVNRSCVKKRTETVTAKVLNGESSDEYDSAKLRIKTEPDIEVVASDDHGISTESSSSSSSTSPDQPRTFPEYSYPSRVEHYWPSGAPDYTAYSQQSRVTNYQQFRQPYPPSATPAYPAVPRSIKRSFTMDYAPSPESFYAPEFMKSTCAASPNSQYLFDQERHDIQNTLNNCFLGHTCTSVDLMPLNSEPEFDLNPQYENSNSLEGYFGGTLNDSMLLGTSESAPSMQSALFADKRGPCWLLELELIESMQTDMKQEGPTLAELNMDPFLMEDIYSIIGEESNSQAASPVNRAASDGRNQATTTTPIKLEPSTASYSPVSPFQTKSQTLPQSASDVLGTKSDVAVVPPINPASIKKEPVDTYDTDNKSCLHKMLSSPPQKPVMGASASAQSSSSPRQVMTMVGQNQAPSLAQQPVKTESVEEKWKEIEKFIHDPEQAGSRKRKRHTSGGSIMSDEEDYKRPYPDNLSDDDYDSDSDVDSDFSDTPLEESLTELAKKSKQYFWQYNVQAKGPKGTRLKLRINNDDPHHPSGFEDPVFDANSTSLVGIRHGGKARKGDGNEVSPNPRKLCQIGQQLYKLNRQINNCQVSNDLPAHVRNKSRKEKNKLASRACRLKKKAQHEANKIKLTGLDTEQNELLEVIHLIWPQLKDRAQQQLKGLSPSPDDRDTITVRLEEIMKNQRKTMIAGKTTDYVNDVIKRVEEGDLTGGLPIKPKIRK